MNVKIEKSFLCSLTQEEIDFLFIITGKISGDPQTSYRKIGNEIWDKLYQHINEQKVKEIREFTSGGINIRSNEDE